MNKFLDQIEDFMYDVIEGRQHIVFYIASAICTLVANIAIFVFVTMKQGIVTDTKEMYTLLYISTAIIHVVLVALMVFFVYHIQDIAKEQKNESRVEKYLEDYFSGSYKKVTVIIKHGTPYLYDCCMMTSQVHVMYDKGMINIKVCDNNGIVIKKGKTNCYFDFVNSIDIPDNIRKEYKL